MSERYTLPELAACWKVSYQAVYQLLKSRGCPIHGTRRKYYVLGTDLEEHLLSRPGQVDTILFRRSDVILALTQRVRRLEMWVNRLRKESRVNRKKSPGYTRSL